MSNGTTSNEEQRESRGGIFEVLRIRVELWVVIVFMALAFGAGIVVTAMYDESPEPVVGVQQPVGQVPIAPPLTDQDIEGGLPSGHPDIDDATGSQGITGATGEAAQGEASDAGGGK
jgi:hypothetical protein